MFCCYVVGCRCQKSGITGPSLGTPDTLGPRLTHHPPLARSALPPQLWALRIHTTHYTDSPEYRVQSEELLKHQSNALYKLHCNLSHPIFLSLGLQLKELKWFSWV